jgi:hypothetical protein
MVRILIFDEITYISENNWIAKIDSNILKLVEQKYI